MNRTPIFTTLLCATALHASAQEKTDLTPAITTPRFTVGLQSGAATMFKANQYYFNRNYNSNLPGVTSGVFARFYMGNHLALQTGINVSVYGKQQYNAYNALDGNKTLSVDSRIISYDIPLQLQYHLLKKDARLRPYFGAGIVLNRTDIHNHSTYMGVDHGNGIYSQNDLNLQFTQGLTYQINKHWQINQSINLNTSSKNGTSASFMFGVGYSFGK